MNSILDPIARPIADVLAAFYSVIPNFGVAILLLSVAWMIIIAPLTLKSTRAMLALQALQPELNKLKEKHKNDRQAFAQAQMDLMRERNVSPFGSCLPMILPMPVFFALFRVIDGLSHHQGGQVVPQYLSPHTAMYKAIVHANGHINAFGMDLSKNALSHHSSIAAALPFFALLLVMIGTQYWQTAMTMNRNQATRDNPQMRMMKFIPIVFGIICIRFPAGVVLYYGMSNVCRIVQQWAMYRYDPKVKALVTQEVTEVEAKTHDLDERDAKGRRSSGSSPPASSSDPNAGAGRPRLRELLAGANEAARAGQGSSRARGGGQGGTQRRGDRQAGPATGAARRDGTAPSSAGAGTARDGGSGARRKAATSNGRDPAVSGGGDRRNSRAASGDGKDRAAGAGKGDRQPGSGGRQEARSGARTGGGQSSSTTVNRSVQPNKPSTGGRNIPARPSRSKRRRKGR